MAARGLNISDDHVNHATKAVSGSVRDISRHIAGSHCPPQASSHKLSMTDLAHGVTVTTHDLRAASIILRVFRAKSGNLVAAALDRRWRRVVGWPLPSTGRWRLKPRRATGGRLRPRPVGRRGGRRRNRLGIFVPPIGAGCWPSCCLPAFWVDGRSRTCGRAAETVRRRDCSASRSAHESAPVPGRPGREPRAATAAVLAGAAEGAADRRPEPYPCDR